LQLEPKEWPPNFDDDSISSEVIIFCNVYEFEIRGDLYVHSDRRIIFEGPPGGLCVSDAGEKPNAETSWIPLPGKTPEEERKINIVFMCSMLEPYKDDPKDLALSAWSTFADLDTRQFLQDNAHFSERLQYTLSFMLMHELFHVATLNDSQYRPSQA
jgi:hypothetical protein